MCGVGAIVSLEGAIENPGNLSRDLLFSSKNRGQDGYGLSIRLDNGLIYTYKFQDIVPELVEKINEFSGKVTAIIAHARYPTSGGKSYNPAYVQPFEERTHKPRYAFAFNGNIVNAEALSDNLAQKGFYVTQKPLLDTEVLQLMIQEQFDKGITDHRVILEYINNQIDGCCNMILLSSDGTVSLAKDRWGFRPLAFAQNEKLLVASSESSVLFKMRFTNPTFVKTGDIVEFIPDTHTVIHSKMKLKVPIEKSRCFFEAVYFADGKTSLWGTPSNNHRYRLGQVLAEQDLESGFTPEDTVVVDVPASALFSAEGYKDALRLSLIPAIIKSPKAKRTFIEQDGKRGDMIREKYIFNPHLIPFIKGKKVILIDDSIVRGSTMKHLVQAFKDFYQPSEVHLRIPSPPIVAPCFYGINMANISELVAPGYFKNVLAPASEELSNLAHSLNADSIKYISHTGLANALKVDISEICMGCITGKYPTPCGQAEYERQLHV